MLIQFSKGDLVIRIVEVLEGANFRPVYLRNYENLPADVGNDVDLLIPEGMAHKAEVLARETAAQVGWKCYKSIQFGPLSLFFHNRSGDDFVHIDLFTRLEWHFLPLADTSAILARRRLCGLVFVPAPMDELFLNVFTRLCYQGVVREKHRDQAASLLSTSESARFPETVREHVGQACSHLVVSRVIDGDWDSLEASAGRCRRLLFLHVLLGRSPILIASLASFVQRGIKRLVSPPGPFVVFTGGQHAVRSTLIEVCIPLLVALTGKSKILHFHGRPSRGTGGQARRSSGLKRKPPEVTDRSFRLSIFLLCYRWLGFWSDYFRRVLPSISRNHPVIGDQYADEFFPDPAQTHINPSRWFRRLAFNTIPTPDLVIGLMTRSELSAAYVEEMRSNEEESTDLAIRFIESQRRNFKVVLTEGSADEVTGAVRSCILSLFSDKCGRRDEV